MPVEINFLLILNLVLLIIGQFVYQFHTGLGKYTEYSVTVAARTQAGVGPYYTPGVQVRTAESSKLIDISHSHY